MLNWIAWNRTVLDIETVFMLKWIVWNRTVLTFNCVSKWLRFNRIVGWYIAILVTTSLCANEWVMLNWIISVR